uniref:Uncharacterized protein n=1 Tax=Setaria viridis TaxID=4556 RepID=A0A4U6TK41_SETVI|nr:hypothetical protein SEVIR_7G036458v2 [Setaria viridis]
MCGRYLLLLLHLRFRRRGPHRFTLPPRPLDHLLLLLLLLLLLNPTSRPASTPPSTAP